jgi:hypothetical protein
MWKFLLLLTGAVALEKCFTDAPTLAEDPTYTYAVSIEIEGSGLFRFQSNIEKIAIGSGQNLDLDKVLHLYTYQNDHPMGIFFSHDVSWLQSAPPLDLTQPFEIYVVGFKGELIQKDELIAIFMLYKRIPFHIGWYNGTLCIEPPTEATEEEEKEEPINYITPFDEL